MESESYIFRRLKSTPGLAALRGRIYPLVAPPTAKAPFGVYIRRSTATEQTFQGPLKQEVAEIALTLFDETYLGATKLVISVRNTLDGFVGFRFGNHILRVAITSESDTFVTADGGEMLPLYGVEMSISVRIVTK